MGRKTIHPATDWCGPAVEAPWRSDLGFFSLFKSLIVPPKGQRVLPTVTGYVLIIMAIGLGMGAYNAASNILFIVLAVLLSSLIVSGVLSWLNFRGICWRIRVDSSCRAGDECVVRIEVRNLKRYLPSYALSFVVCTQRERMKKVVHVGQRLGPGRTVRLTATFVPRRRGRETVRLQGVVSQFPFGFLRKTLNGGPPREINIWPRRIAYEFEHRGASTAQPQGRTLAKVGSGSEFIHLRGYRPGDSHRQIHWKASARLRNLVVQEFAAESHSGFVFLLRTEKRLWPEEDRFEQLCSFVSSLAEDLFRQDRLHGFRIDDDPPQRIVRKGDLDYLQDRLALLERSDGTGAGSAGVTGNTVTFEPGAPEGIVAYVGGQKAATA